MANFENDIHQAVIILQQGGIILYPTDTIWGIGCDATNSAAVKRIYQLKNREEKKSMIILLPNENEIEKFVSDPSKKIIDFLSVQKKPTTAIFDHAINLPQNLVNPDGSIAIRIVRDDFCQVLLHRLGKPLVSTSANISGNGSPKNFSDIGPAIKKGVDYIVFHRRQEEKMYHPSAIIKLNILKEIEKIR